MIFNLKPEVSQLLLTVLQFLSIYHWRSNIKSIFFSPLFSIAFFPIEFICNCQFKLCIVFRMHFGLAFQAGCISFALEYHNLHGFSLASMEKWYSGWLNGTQLLRLRLVFAKWSFFALFANLVFFYCSRDAKHSLWKVFQQMFSVAGDFMKSLEWNLYISVNVFRWICLKCQQALSHLKKKESIKSWINSFITSERVKTSNNRMICLEYVRSQTLTHWLAHSHTKENIEGLWKVSFNRTNE